MSTETTASVSTHILDTSIGRPAAGVAITLTARSGSAARWTALGGSKTDTDGRCKDLPALPEGTTHVRLDFETESYFLSDRGNDRGNDRSNDPSNDRSNDRDTDQQAEAKQDAPRVRDSGAFFPEVAITFAVTPGEHYHVPLLLNPFGYSVYRGS
ncbi:hydroxyisourate hydrolase [Streptomyces sp. 21So2-11]|uniref:hydroxyisourate hydrolase n=1 Tax=Streptomyces sp. 21So2-11 TaxID=3144408 RepID=UPI00321B690D